MYQPHKYLDSKTKTKKKFFLTISDAIRDALTANGMSHIIKVDLQRILAWYILDYFQHTLDLVLQATKNFRPQTNDETKMAHNVTLQFTTT